MSLLVGALVGVGLLAAAPQWSGPQECPGEQLEARIERFLGGSSASDRDDVQADVRVRQLAGGYRLELRLQVGERRRRHVVQGHDCAELVDFAAVLIASAIDPFALGGPREIDALAVEPWVEEPAILVEAPRVVASTDPATDQASAERPPIQVPKVRPSSQRVTQPPPVTLAPRMRVEPEPPAVQPSLVAGLPPRDRPEPREGPVPLEGFIAVAGMGFAGLFPSPSGGVELAGGLDRKALRFTGGLAGWFGGRFRDPVDPSVGGNLWALGPVLELCGSPSVRRVSFPLCGTALGGAEVGQGVGMPRNVTQVRPWLAIGGDVGVRWRVHPRVGLRLGIGVSGSVVRPVWETPPIVYTTPPVLGRLRLGIELIPRRR